MGVDRILREARAAVEKIVPANIEITAIDFEGPVIVIYTKNMEEFARNADLIKKLAQGLRKRVSIRPDPSTMLKPEDAEEKIRAIIPEEAKIVDIFFEDSTGQVTIEALAPGIVIGKKGNILNEIKKVSGWAPNVVRSPPIPSKTVSEIRAFLRSKREERKVFLRKVGRKIARQTLDGEDWVRVTALGGYREVGRSAHLLMTRNSKVLIDCGIDASSSQTPYLNVPELMPLETLDAVVLTHAHLDHSGLIPALYKYGYDGPVYATPPTRDLMALLQLDYMKVAVSDGSNAPYSSAHVQKEVLHTITLKYGETTDIAPDIRMTFHNAGHILGSAVAHFHIGDGAYNVAFTGDIKYEKTWLFNPAVNRFPRVETVVMESTYGGHNDTQPSRHEAAAQLEDILRRTQERGGKVLIPVFSVGRSQEVMLVIEEKMRHGEIPEMPVYLDGMIWEATAIHTAYPEFLNNSLKNRIFKDSTENPFLSPIFHRVETRDMRERIINDPEPLIVLSTSGMMNGGPVMEYFKNWADEPKNSIIFVGYQAEGTIGRKVQGGMKEITFNSRGKQIGVEINMEISTIDGFSGHSDRRQLINYIANMEPRPERIILSHGEEKKSLDLAASIHRKFNYDTRVPKNLETIRLH